MIAAVTVRLMLTQQRQATGNGCHHAWPYYSMVEAVVVVVVAVVA